MQVNNASMYIRDLEYIRSQYTFSKPKIKKFNDVKGENDDVQVALSKLMGL